MTTTTGSNTGGKIRQWSGMVCRRRKCKTDIGQRELPAVIEYQEQVRRGPQRAASLLHLRKLFPAQAQLLAAARLEQARAPPVAVLDGHDGRHRLAGESEHPLFRFNQGHVPRAGAGSRTGGPRLRTAKYPSRGFTDLTPLALHWRDWGGAGPGLW